METMLLVAYCVPFNYVQWHDITSEAIYLFIILRNQKNPELRAPAEGVSSNWRDGGIQTNAER